MTPLFSVVCAAVCLHSAKDGLLTPSPLQSKVVVRFLCSFDRSGAPFFILVLFVLELIPVTFFCWYEQFLALAINLGLLWLTSAVWRLLYAWGVRFAAYGDKMGVYLLQSALEHAPYGRTCCAPTALGPECPKFCTSHACHFLCKRGPTASDEGPVLEP